MIAIDDLKYAIRLLAKRPGFTILTALVMATGIGLSIFLFAFFNTILFKALPFEDGESIVRIAATQNGVKGFGSSIDVHDYYDIRTNLGGLSEFSAYRNANVNVIGRDGARRYNAVYAEPNIFQLTRTKTTIGREFTDVENQVGAENVVVIGYDMWQNQYGADPQILDKVIRINGESHRIIGVMPQGYLFPNIADMWLPMRQDATKLARGNSDGVYGLAHIDKGTDLKLLNSELNTIVSRLEERYPKTNTGIGAYVDSLQMTAAGDGIAVVYAMHIAAILILILAAINVGNLLLSRAIERGKETAIRVALGAPRSRLISQMLWESILICTIGGLIGLLVIAWGMEVTESVTASFFTDKPAFWWKFGIDSYTLKIFLIFILGTIFITGFLPAWKNSGADFNAVLRDGTRGALGKKTGRLNRILVVCEIFLSITILIVAGVIVIGTFMSSRADYGADTANKLTARVVLTETDYASSEKQTQFVKKLQSRLENSTGIGDVMISSALPGMSSATPTMALDGKEYTKDKGYPRANYISVTPGSLRKLGVELVEGRYLNNVDDSLDKRSVVVTESFVARHFTSESPLGKRLRIVGIDDDEPEWLTIVGVVEHTIQGSPNDESGKTPSVFRPFGQAPQLQMIIAMQMKTSRFEMVRELRKTLGSIDPELPAFRIETYDDSIARISAPLRFTSSLLLLIGLATAILAASGIYGVMSNTIVQRTQEIGVKRALGAIEGRITKEFLGKGLKQLLWGGIPGLLAGCGLGYGMAKVLGIQNTLLVAISVTIVGVITGVILFASYWPTKRVLKMEPSAALRHE